MARTKGSVNVTPEQIQRFRRKRDTGMSTAKAAQAVGMSAAWGYKQVELDKAQRQKRDADDPGPAKSLDQLDGGVKDCLRDFSLFEQTFLARRPVPWRRDAAMRTVEWLLDESPDPHYVVINVPPGAGKTTLFTHDIPLWLICGGGAEDPEWGRAIRILLGSETKNVSEHYTLRLRRVFESPRPYSYYDKGARERHTAELSIVREFGRFKPIQALGEPSVWKANEFTVAQLVDVDLVEKEPTVQAASRESGFLGERVDYYSWDDLVTKKNSRAHEIAQSLSEWTDDEVETRLEPGGVGAIVGQRLGPLDLYRNRLDQVWTDEDGVERQKYHHIIYPAHMDELCDGNHRQWDGGIEGCLLDEYRLSWRKLLRAQSGSNFKTVYQQEDADPSSVLVQEAWLSGGTDRDGFPAPGCYDQDRGFYEWPRINGLFDYVTVDPAAGNWWAIEWWAWDAITNNRYLIWGGRKKLKAGEFLDWHPDEKHHTGLMEEMQEKSGKLGHPIRMWIVEQNAAHKYLFQYEHYRTWRQKWPRVEVTPHSTQKNKTDENLGIEALLTMPYKTGKKRLPRKHDDLAALNYMRVKVKELTTYPFSRTWDTVMADWFGEFNMEKIRSSSLRYTDTAAPKPHPYLSPQERSQQKETLFA